MKRKGWTGSRQRKRDKRVARLRQRERKRQVEGRSDQRRSSDSHGSSVDSDGAGCCCLGSREGKVSQRVSAVVFQAKIARQMPSHHSDKSSDGGRSRKCVCVCEESKKQQQQVTQEVRVRAKEVRMNV